MPNGESGRYLNEKIKELHEAKELLKEIADFLYNLSGASEDCASFELYELITRIDTMTGVNQGGEP